MLDLPLVLWNSVPRHSVIDSAYFPHAGRLFTASAEGQICLWVIEEEADGDSDAKREGRSDSESSTSSSGRESPAPGATGEQDMLRKQHAVERKNNVRITPAAIMCTPDCHRIVALGSALTAIEKEFKEILISIEEDGSIAKWSIHAG